MVAAAVFLELLRTGRSSCWLSAQAGISLRALERKLAAEEDFTVAELAGISRALGIPTSRLLPTLSREKDETLLLKEAESLSPNEDETLPAEDGMVSPL